MKGEARSAWMVAGAGGLWGLISLFVRLLQEQGMTSLQIVFFRNLLAAAALGLIITIKDRKALRIRLRDIWMFIGTGMVSIALFNYCYFVTLSRSSVAVASLLLYTSPVFIMVLSAILFHERMTRKKLLALGITIAGCACITGIFSQAQTVAPLTILLGLGSGLFYGLYSIFAKFALPKYHAMTVSFYTFAFAALATAPFCAVGCAATVAAHPEGLAAGLGLALVSTVLPFLLYTAGLKGMQASRAAVLATVEPLVGSLLGVVVFGDPFTVWTLLGMVLIFSAITVLQLPQRGKAEALHG
ncbi:MAG: EamA family transporter [Eubacteriales bacterium]|nr:EamA family transporter [Eubacteriales bacterium]